MKIRVLLVTPDGAAEFREVDPYGDDLRGLVGGWLEGVSSGLGSGWHAYCDEEGRLKGLPVNLAATQIALRLGWPRGDVLCGPVVFCGTDGAEEADVPENVVTVARQIGLSLE